MRSAHVTWGSQQTAVSLCHPLMAVQHSPSSLDCMDPKLSPDTPHPHPAHLLRVRLIMCVRVYLYICTGACGNQKTAFGIDPRVPPTLFVAVSQKQGLFLRLELTG